MGGVKRATRCKGGEGGGRRGERAAVWPRGKTAARQNGQVNAGERRRGGAGSAAERGRRQPWRARGGRHARPGRGVRCGKANPEPGTRGSVRWAGAAAAWEVNSKGEAAAVVKRAPPPPRRALIAARAARSAQTRGKARRRKRRRARKCAPRAPQKRVRGSASKQAAARARGR